METLTKQSADISEFNFVHTAKIASLALEKAKRLADLNLASAKVALEKSVRSASALADVKDLEELFTLRAKLAETGVQYATAYSKDLYQVMSEMQADFSALLQETWTAYAAAVGAWAEKSAKAAPVGSNIAVKAVKSTLAATTETIEQLSEATQQAGRLADETIRAVMTEAAPEAEPRAKTPKSAKARNKRT
jgi:phasin family protein